MAAPRPDGLQSARAMEIALADACTIADEVEYINAHASATRLNDPTETRAIEVVLGERAYRGWIPPTLNLHDPAPECDLGYVLGEGRRTSVRFVVSNSIGFGDVNAALVLRLPE